MDLKALLKAPRLLMEAALKPAQGVRFQPTGFADLGAAEFKRPDGTEMLLVESAQSVANRLEKTCIQGDGPDIDLALAGLSYMKAKLPHSEGAPETSSLIEAHRIGSPYFLSNKEFRSRLREEMNYHPKRPLDSAAIHRTLFKYDVNSLVHGVFLSLLEGGRVRTPRALTGFIEAEKVERVVSGGVKNSLVDPTGELQAASDDKDVAKSGVYSNVPFPRVEYAAEKITAYFNLDLSLIRGFGLPEEACELLVGLALLKVRRFMTAHLRLRTACNLLMDGDLVTTNPNGFHLPCEEELLEAVQSGIRNCKPLFADPPVTELTTPVKVVPKKQSQD